MQALVWVLPLAAAVSAAAPAPGAAGAQCVLVPRTDLMGNDLLASNTSKPLPQPCPSPEACCAMCSAHDPASEPKGRCGAWSWNLQSKTCWMKTKMSDNPRTCTDTSGVLSNPSRPLGRTLLIANFSATDAVTTFGTVTKDARNPLLKVGAQREVDQDPKRPWSTGGIYSAIVADQTGKRMGKPWRAYFTAGLNWTMDPQCPPGDTCETGAAGLLYAESEDGIAWEQPNVGIMWPPNANGTRQTRSDILRLVEAGTAIFEDDNPAVRAGKSEEEWSIKFVGQLSMADDSKMHSGGSGEYLTSTDGRTFDGAGKVDVDGGRTPGARW